MTLQIGLGDALLRTFDDVDPPSVISQKYPREGKIRAYEWAFFAVCSSKSYGAFISKYVDLIWDIR